MSKANESSQPLMTFERPMVTDPVTMIGFLTVGGLLTSFIVDTPLFLAFVPVTLYIAWLSVWTVIAFRKEKVRASESSERISDYLARNYSLSVSPRDCLKYCADYFSPYSETVVSAEDLKTGEKARVVLHFSQDLSSVTPMRLTPVH